VPESWKNAVDEEVPVKKEEPEFVKKIQRVMARNEGDELPVSAFLEWRTAHIRWVPRLMKSVELLQ